MSLIRLAIRDTILPMKVLGQHEKNRKYLVEMASERVTTGLTIPLCSAIELLRVPSINLVVYYYYYYYY
jgi:hypothetical protein